MLDRWQREVAAGRGRMDVYADYNAVTLQITCEALFGSEMPRAQAQKLAEAVKVAFEFFAARAATGFIVPEWWECHTLMLHNLLSLNSSYPSHLIYS